MSPLFSLPLAAALCLGVSACGSLKHFTAKADEKRRKRAVERIVEASGREAAGRLGQGALGEVAQVGANEDYILISALSGAVFPKDAVLESRRGATVTGEYRLSPENSHGFHVADVVKGDPTVGDSIFLSGKQQSRLVEVPTAPVLPPLSPGSDPLKAISEAASVPAPTGTTPSSSGPPVPPASGSLDLPPMDQRAGLVIPAEPPRILTAEEITRSRVSATPPPPPPPQGWKPNPR